MYPTCSFGLDRARSDTQIYPFSSQSVQLAWQSMQRHTRSWYKKITLESLAML